MYFLNINKPVGITSFDVIAKLRKRLQIKQIGHSGTLDPLANGVMQVAVGKATKLLDYLPSDKKYRAQIKFGYTTDTLDGESDEIFIAQPNFSKEKLCEVLESFLGVSLQVPPKFSAIKINGQKMCDLARKNIDLMPEIDSREIEIYAIDLIDFSLSDYTATIDVFCKKGTYIRSLIRDIGEKLTCGAYMTGLIRTSIGLFDISNSNNLDDVELIKINPLDVLGIEKYELSDDEFNKITHGNFIFANNKISNNLVLLTKNNKLVSIAKMVDNQIRPRKLFLED